eukprot:TRINITY_DN10692_c0_g1_i1.p1 TRINITY_DN10692_c0_g1~~TRINITY_DN10692_c0_g1_i1.p1  ORF type:complete len:719 (-),score=133.38 TRINITY_DN10692_c0_g1_i1:303-2459(-)
MKGGRASAARASQNATARKSISNDMGAYGEILGGIHDYGRVHSDAHGHAPCVSRMFHWVKTAVGKESATLDANEVVKKVGVPKKILVKYLANEIHDESAVIGLPFAIFLLLTYTMMGLLKEDAAAVRGVEQAIDFDIGENANFAFSHNMGHKTFVDVNTYADFWSWLRLGMMPLYGPADPRHSVSEEVTHDIGALNAAEARTYLRHNRKITPLQISQSTGRQSDCKNPKIAKALGIACTADALDMFWLNPTEMQTSQSRVTGDQLPSVWLNGTPEQILQLEKDKWIGKDTLRLKVSFSSYNPESDVLCLTSVQFVFPRSGHIFKELTHRSLRLDPYTHWSIHIWECLFYAQVTWMAVMELLDIAICLKKEGCNPIRAFKDYAGIWNAIDWASIVIAYLTLSFWITSMGWRTELVDLLTTLPSPEEVGTTGATDRFEDFHDRIESAGYMIRDFRGVGAIFPLIILLRCFKAFACQPRLALVTKTLVHASTDLFHFGIVFLSVFMTYSLMGTLFFGREDIEFTTLDRSVMACFKMLMGEFSTEKMSESGREFPTMIFFFSFMIMMVLIVLNMLIAIIMDSYSEVKGSTVSAETLNGQIVELMTRTWQSRFGQRVSLKKIHDALTDTTKSSWPHDGYTILTPDDLASLVPNLTDLQAFEELEGAARNFAANNTNPVQLAEVMSVCASVSHELAGVKDELFALRKDFNMNLIGLSDDKGLEL